MPRIPRVFWSYANDIFDWDIERFNYVKEQTGLYMKEQYGMSNEDVSRQGFLNAHQTTGGILHVFQEWVKHGERIVAVSEDSLTLAENTDCLSRVEGDQILNTFPCFAFWMPRRVGCSTTHFVVVRFIDDIRGGRAWTPFTVGGEQRHCSFEAEYGHKGEVSKSLAISVIHTYDEETKRPLQQEGDISIETSVIPLVGGMTILDCICQLVYGENTGMLKDAYLKARSSTDNSTKTESDPLVKFREGFLDLLNTVFGLCLTMASYPEYVGQREVKYREEPKSKKEKKKKSKVGSMKIVDLKVPVLEDPKELPQGSVVSGKRVHWRRGYWRRQVHGEAWRSQNPDAEVLTLPDGREAHMKWIRPAVIGAKDV